MNKPLLSFDNNNAINFLVFTKAISKFIKKFNTIFLYGELGVGKTTFVKYLINNFQKKEKTKITEIPSPTFNIVYEYKIKKLRIQHFDLYRLKNKKECLNIGLFEDDNVISIIEWPEKVHFKPKKRPRKAYQVLNFPFLKKIPLKTPHF